MAPKSATKPVSNRPFFMKAPSSVIARLDAWVDALNAAPAGPRWTRTALVIAIFIRALEDRGARGEAP